MNTQINVNVQGEIRFPDLALLAQAITGKVATAASVAANVPASAPVTPTVAAAPVSAPAPAIPTGTPKYSIDDIARAGAMLAQQGPEKLAGLNSLLQQFGLQSVTELRSEQTPAFVQAMRGLGAQI